MVKAPEPDKILITSPAQLLQEFATLQLVLDKNETEHTWEIIDKALRRFHAVVRGGGCKFTEDFIKAIREREMVVGIIRSMATERTRLSGTTLELLASITRLGPLFQPLLAHYLPTLLRLLCRTNKLYISRSSAALHSIIHHTKLSADILRYIVAEWKVEAGKSSTYRTAAAEAVRLSLEVMDRTSEKEVVERRMDELEWIIKVGAVDKEPKVRAEIKQVWEVYKEIWPERVPQLTAPMTPIIRRYLNVATSVHAPSNATSILAAKRPVAPKPRVPSASSSSGLNAPAKPVAPSTKSSQVEKPVKSLARSVGTAATTGLTASTSQNAKPRNHPSDASQLLSRSVGAPSLRNIAPEPSSATPVFQVQHSVRAGRLQKEEQKSPPSFSSQSQFRPAATSSRYHVPLTNLAVTGLRDLNFPRPIIPVASVAPNFSTTPTATPRREIFKPLIPSSTTAVTFNYSITSHSGATLSHHTISKPSKVMTMTNAPASTSIPTSSLTTPQISTGPPELQKARRVLISTKSTATSNSGNPLSRSTGPFRPKPANVAERAKGVRPLQLATGTRHASQTTTIEKPYPQQTVAPSNGDMLENATSSHRSRSRSPEILRGTGPVSQATLAARERRERKLAEAALHFANSLKNKDIAAMEASAKAAAVLQATAAQIPLPIDDDNDDNLLLPSSIIGNDRNMTLLIDTTEPIVDVSVDQTMLEGDLGGDADHLSELFDAVLPPSDNKPVESASLCQSPSLPRLNAMESSVSSMADLLQGLSFGKDSAISSEKLFSPSQSENESRQAEVEGVRENVIAIDTRPSNTEQMVTPDEDETEPTKLETDESACVVMEIPERKEQETRMSSPGLVMVDELKASDDSDSLTLDKSSIILGPNTPIVDQRLSELAVAVKNDHHVDASSPLQNKEMQISPPRFESDVSGSASAIESSLAAKDSSHNPFMDDLASLSSAFFQSQSCSIILDTPTKIEKPDVVVKFGSLSNSISNSIHKDVIKNDSPSEISSATSAGMHNSNSSHTESGEAGTFLEDQYTFHSGDEDEEEGEEEEEEEEEETKEVKNTSDVMLGQSINDKQEVTKNMIQEDCDDSDEDEDEDVIFGPTPTGFLEDGDAAPTIMLFSQHDRFTAHLPIFAQLLETNEESENGGSKINDSPNGLLEQALSGKSRQSQNYPQAEQESGNAEQKLGSDASFVDPNKTIPRLTRSRGKESEVSETPILKRSLRSRKAVVEESQNHGSRVVRDILSEKQV